ncbi:MAG: hypothetical protein IPN40_11545 [Uliginosibacterium sp.]|nr:hypothetical protein [Uliginosibacterium sp.]
MQHSLNHENPHFSAAALALGHRQRIRGLLDSLRAEGAYVYWVCLFIRWMSGCALLGTGHERLTRRHEDTKKEAAGPCPERLMA